MDDVIIREIKPQDNLPIAAVIRTVLAEFNVPLEGTALSDPELDMMFETYSQPGSLYFVVIADGAVAGGAGIAPLRNAADSICELQKMYFLPGCRGRGIGRQLIEKCIIGAKSLGYQKCYLETMPYMEAAQQLYAKAGFRFIDKPLGHTGHTSCPVWMLLDFHKPNK